MNSQFSILNFHKSTTRLLIYSFIGLFVYLLIAPFANAAGCNPIYGGGQTCTDTTITVTKEVLNPSTNLFVHDLGIKDTKYHGNDLVTFQIAVTNNSNNTIDNITLKDDIPSALRFSDGPGTYNPSTRTLTFSIKNLSAHGSQLFTVNTHAVSQDKFPSNVFCSSNQITAIPSKGAVVEDSSQVCFEKINTTPSTGPEELGYITLFVSGLIGLGIKRFSKKNI